MDWAVEVEATVATRLTDNVLEGLLEAIGHGAALSGGNRRLSATMTISDTYSPSLACVEAVNVFTNATKLVGLADVELVRVHARTYAELDAEETGADLVGITEVAKLIGRSRQRAVQLAARHNFPSPVAELASGRVWRRDHVTRWLAAHYRNNAASVTTAAPAAV